MDQHGDRPVEGLVYILNDQKFIFRPYRSKRYSLHKNMTLSKIVDKAYELTQVDRNNYDIEMMMWKKKKKAEQKIEKKEDNEMISKMKPKESHNSNTHVNSEPLFFSKAGSKLATIPELTTFEPPIVQQLVTYHDPSINLNSLPLPGRVRNKSTTSDIACNSILVDDDLKLNQIFDSREELVRKIRIVSIKKNREIKTKKVDSRRFIGVCVDKNCKWRIFAKLFPFGGLWTVKRYYNIHTCSIEYMNHRHQDATAKLLLNL
ncbi:hypothetical protein PHJA_002371300 [Phtheirospermum japonicum]|uniref:Transposase MuDR plant domain-containing protein n=1 Tax=Phtheirospermum japonicum TaxID=374723 RepID=A0A830CVK2_9LAMI|nr:hypothetical protein PHJA_002371300 [Phtheirospermum japonicum]